MKRKADAVGRISKQRDYKHYKTRQRVSDDEPRFYPQRSIASAREFRPIYVNKKMMSELKWVDVSKADSTAPQYVNNVGTFAILNATAIGPASFQRIGKTINMRSVMLRYFLSVSDTGQSVENYWPTRVSLVWDNQVKGAPPATSDVFQSQPNAGAGSSAVFSDLNLNNKKRFVILRDSKFITPTAKLGPSTRYKIGDAPEGGKSGYMICDWFVNLQGMETTYNNGTAVNATDIITGGLYLFYMNVDGGGSPIWEIKYTSRVRYTG